MPFSQEKDTFIVMAYFRTGHQNEDGLWTYSSENSYNQFLLQFPEDPLAYPVYLQHMQIVIDRFMDTGSVDNRKKSGRPRIITEDVIADVQQRMQASPTKPLRKLAVQTGKQTVLIVYVIDKIIILFYRTLLR